MNILVHQHIHHYYTTFFFHTKPIVYTLFCIFPFSNNFCDLGIFLYQHISASFCLWLQRHSTILEQVIDFWKYFNSAFKKRIRLIQILGLRYLSESSSLTLVLLVYNKYQVIKSCAINFEKLWQKQKILHQSSSWFYCHLILHARRANENRRWDDKTRRFSHLRTPVWRDAD